MTAYVGIHLHRRRSLVVCIDEEGERLWWRRIDNSPVALVEVVAEAGANPEVVTGRRHTAEGWRPATVTEH